MCRSHTSISTAYGTQLSLELGFFLISFAAALCPMAVLRRRRSLQEWSSTAPSTPHAWRVMDIALPLAGVMTLWLGILERSAKRPARSTGWRNHRAVLLAHLPRGAERPPRHRPHGDELLGQPARSGQRGHAVRPEGDGQPAVAQSRQGQASNAQIMFLVLHTSGLTLDPAVDHGAARGARRGRSVRHFHPLHDRDLRRHRCRAWSPWRSASASTCSTSVVLAVAGRDDEPSSPASSGT
jgi:hypothetical protein